MMQLLFFFVSFCSSVVGSICGIGGGVIIKPVLDATELMSVSCISFLSGCTVLSMSIISVYKAIRYKTTSINIRIATALAIGASAGGIFGKILFEHIKESVPREDLVGLIQTIVVILITAGTLIYTIKKNAIKTKHYTQLWIGVAIGVLLGVMSSFLGIGGGPINLVVLAYFFSMTTKQAALSSLYIIMFSQMASLVQTVIGEDVPQMERGYLILMVIGGVIGGLVGSKINKKIADGKVNILFVSLMIIIIGISFYNVYQFTF